MKKSIIITVLFLVGNVTIAQNAKGVLSNKQPVTFLCPPCGLDCDTVHFEKPGLCPTCAMQLFASYPEFENRQGEHGDMCQKKVAVLLFPGVEIIDFSGPWEVFGAAGMEVFSVAASDTMLTTGMGLKIKPDYSFANAPVPDIILIPGGSVDPSDMVVVNWITQTSQKAAHTMSVCTGAFLLAASGLLDGLTATTNYPAIQVLRQMSPKTTVVDKVRFVDNGRIITSAGLSSGIDATFHLVSLYIGKAQTTKLANDLEYGWSDANPFVRSKLADRFVQDFLNALTPFDYEMTEYSGDQSKWSVSVKLKTDLAKPDLLKILAVQFEQVAGWSKTKKGSKWAFYEGDEKWLAILQVLQNGISDYLLTLRVAVTGN